MNKDPKIEVYTKDWCPYCKRAKAFLKSKKLSHVEYNIDKEDKWDEMVERTGNKTVPQIIIDGRVIGGYDDIIEMEKNDELSVLLNTEKIDHSKRKWELIVLGAGPAGLNAALYAARKGIDLLLLSKDVGGQVIDTGEIDNYLGKEEIQGSDLIFDFWDHLLKYDISTVIGEEVVNIEKNKDENIIRTDNNKEYITDAVIIASGTQKRKLGMKQEYVLAGKGVHYCASCDGFLYAGKSVAVVGGGNSGLEAALDLADLDCEVYLIEIQDHLMGDEYLQQKVKERDEINIHTSSMVDKIKGEDKLTSVAIKDKNDKSLELDIEGLFIEIGLEANTDFVSNLLELNEQKEIIIDENNKTNVKGIWAAGDVSSIKDKQIITSAAEGAKAALRANEYLK